MHFVVLSFRVADIIKLLNPNLDRKRDARDKLLDVSLKPECIRNGFKPVRLSRRALYHSVSSARRENEAG